MYNDLITFYSTYKLSSCVAFLLGHYIMTFARFYAENTTLIVFFFLEYQKKVQADEKCEFLKTSYILITCFGEIQFTGVYQFCGSDKTPLVMDTTFDLCDMWLTDKKMMRNVK